MSNAFETSGEALPDSFIRHMRFDLEGLDTSEDTLSKQELKELPTAKAIRQSLERLEGEQISLDSTELVDQ